jgi:hypothetical protein
MRRVVVTAVVALALRLMNILPMQTKTGRIVKIDVATTAF